jgi:Protein of unknown function (DUF2946)
VTGNTESTLRRQGAPLARLLAFALLLFIGYGATAEVAHKHGNILSDGRASSATTLSHQGDANSSSETSRRSGECLICQLHQHLFSSLLNAPPLVAPPTAQMARSAADTISYLLQTDAPRRGRAPPPTSLV